MSALITWLRAKFGRIVTVVGFFFSGVETFDISVIKDPLEGLLGHRVVLFLTVACFVLSFVRHQQVANKHRDPPPTDDGK